MASEIKVTINAKGVITGGKQVESGLDRISQQAKKTQTDLKKAVNVDVKGSLPQLSQFASGLTGISSGLGLVARGGIAGLVIAGIGKAAFAAADASEQLNNALLGLQTVARNSGADIGFMTEKAKSLSKDGLVPLTDVSASLKNLLASGLSAEKSVKLFEALKDSAAFNRQGFLSMGEAIKGATEGIKNGNSILVDNAGVTRNLSLLQKDYAAAIGKTIGQLTDAEKMEANYVGILKEASKFTGDAAKLTDTYTGAKARLSTAIERATATLGDYITQSSLVKGTLNALAGLFENIGFASLSADEKIKILQEDLANFKPGLSFFAKEQKQDLIDQIAYLKEIAQLEKLRGAQGAYEANIKREQIELTKKQQEETQKLAKEEATRLKAVDKLKKTLIDAGKSEIQALKDVKDRRLQLAKGDAEARLLIEKDFQAKVRAINEKATKDAQREADKQRRILNKEKQYAFDALGQSASSPFASVNKPEFKNKDQSASFDNRRALGQGVGVLNNVAQGAEGAKALVVAGAGAALDTIAPGLGQAAKPLLDAFAEGPEATKAMVKEFAEALPVIIEGFVEAIPVFIEAIIEEIPTLVEKLAEAAPRIIDTLADKAPVIITRLAENAPKIIGTLVENAPKIIAKLVGLAPQIALSLIGEIIKNVPRLIFEFARGIYDAIMSVFNGVGDIGGGVNDWLGDNLGFKFARGGEVPSGAGTAFRDTVPAMLMGGERVLDRETNAAFKRFVEKGGSGQGDLLNRVIQLLEEPMTIFTETKVDKSAFANIILNLSRTHQRTS